MVERFNGRLVELIGQTRFALAAELESTLTQYHATYNHRIPQRDLKHQTPIQTLKAWRKTQPDLFVKNVYEHPGLDSSARFALRPPFACVVCVVAHGDMTPARP